MFSNSISSSKSISSCDFSIAISSSSDSFNNKIASTLPENQNSSHFSSIQFNKNASFSSGTFIFNNFTISLSNSVSIINHHSIFK
ncbi:MAG: hypothetical protein Q8S84_09595 [bacterium]|nr:hypothetical protein [bacterium]